MKEQEEKIKTPLEESINGLSDILIHSKNKDIYKVIIESIERPLIEKVLERTFGNQYKAAKILGINRNTLHSKIKKFNIDLEKFKII